MITALGRLRYKGIELVCNNRFTKVLEQTSFHFSDTKVMKDSNIVVQAVGQLTTTSREVTDTSFCLSRQLYSQVYIPAHIIKVKFLKLHITKADNSQSIWENQFKRKYSVLTSEHGSQLAESG